MSQYLNIAGLVIGFFGALLGYLDSRRTGSRFNEGSVKLGYSAQENTWFLRNCGKTGFILLTISFFLQFTAAVISWK